MDVKEREKVSPPRAKKVKGSLNVKQDYNSEKQVKYTRLKTCNIPTAMDKSNGIVKRVYRTGEATSVARRLRKRKSQRLKTKRMLGNLVLNSRLRKQIKKPVRKKSLKRKHLEPQYEASPSDDVDEGVINKRSKHEKPDEVNQAKKQNTDQGGSEVNIPKTQVDTPRRKIFRRIDPEVLHLTKEFGEYRQLPKRVAKLKPIERFGVVVPSTILTRQRNTLGKQRLYSEKPNVSVSISPEPTPLISREDVNVVQQTRDTMVKEGPCASQSLDPLLIQSDRTNTIPSIEDGRKSDQQFAKEGLIECETKENESYDRPSTSRELSDECVALGTQNNQEETRQTANEFKEINHTDRPEIVLVITNESQASRDQVHLDDEMLKQSDVIDKEIGLGGSHVGEHLPPLVSEVPPESGEFLENLLTKPFGHEENGIMVVPLEERESRWANSHLNQVQMQTTSISNGRSYYTPRQEMVSERTNENEANREDSNLEDEEDEILDGNDGEILDLRGSAHVGEPVILVANLSQQSGQFPIIQQPQPFFGEENRMVTSLEVGGHGSVNNLLNEVQMLTIGEPPCNSRRPEIVPEEGQESEVNGGRLHLEDEVVEIQDGDQDGVLDLSRGAHLEERMMPLISELPQQSGQCLKNQQPKPFPIEVITPLEMGTSDVGNASLAEEQVQGIGKKQGKHNERNVPRNEKSQEKDSQSNSEVDEGEREEALEMEIESTDEDTRSDSGPDTREEATNAKKNDEQKRDIFRTIEAIVETTHNEELICGYVGILDQLLQIVMDMLENNGGEIWGGTPMNNEDFTYLSRLLVLSTEQRLRFSRIENSYMLVGDFLLELIRTALERQQSKNTSEMGSPQSPQPPGHSRPSTPPPPLIPLHTMEENEDPTRLFTRRPKVAPGFNNVGMASTESTTHFHDPDHAQMTKAGPVTNPEEPAYPKTLSAGTSDQRTVHEPLKSSPTFPDPPFPSTSAFGMPLPRFSFDRDTSQLGFSSVASTSNPVSTPLSDSPESPPPASNSPESPSEGGRESPFLKIEELDPPPHVKIPCSPSSEGNQTDEHMRDLVHTISFFQRVLKSEEMDSKYLSGRGNLIPPLNVAAEKGNLKVVQACIRAGVKLNKLARDGNAPLHKAAIGGDLPCVKELVRSGANPWLRNLQARNAINLARDHSKNYVAEFLESFYCWRDQG